jgi:hypothetical protein
MEAPPKSNGERDILSGSPLCGLAFPQVAVDRQGQS